MNGHYLFSVSATLLSKNSICSLIIFLNCASKKINGKWRVKFFSKNAPEAVREKLDDEGKQILDEKNKPEWEKSQRFI